MSTKTAKTMYDAALSATITTTLYTAPALTPGAIVACITLANTNTTTARIVTIDFGATKTLLPAITLLPNESRVIFLNRAMTTGQTIRGGQSTGTDVECSISGYEFSA